MGFSATEVTNFDKKTVAGVIDANSSGMWYDSQLSFIPSVLNKNILTQYDQIPVASTLTIARTNATNNPLLIQDKSQTTSAVRLTAITGTNGSTYVATTTYGSYGEAVRLRNWIHPVKVPQATGVPSSGYTVKLYQGNPAAGGVEILASTGLTGSGVTATPAWIFNYDQGILLISDDYRGTLTNPYILGFRYIGESLSDTLAALSGTSTQDEVDLIEASVGLTTGGAFTAPSGTTYIGSATSVMNSATLLDAAITALATQVSNLPSGGGTALEGIFVLDVTPSSTGIVSSKTHPTTVPSNKVLSTCITDTTNVRVTVGIDGSNVTYSPTVTIAGVTATVSESSTIRWFTAVADITVSSGTSTITAVTNTGASATFDITLAGAGPNILSATVGAYPNSQTALKAGDVVEVNITTEAGAVEVALLATGASSTARNLTVTANQVVASITIGSATGSQVLTFKAKNSFGTYGDTYSTVALSLDQVYPSFGTFTVTYPASKGALNVGDSATVNCVVSNATSVAYSATGLTVDSPSVYAASKIANLSSTGYVDSGTNYLITATKASNNSTSTKTGLVNIATPTPTASITTSPSGRMVGSPTGINYTVTITSTQNLSTAPTLNASAGEWVGVWSGSNKTWSRALKITDATVKGTAIFSALTLVNQALLNGSTITSGDTYIVGGFSSRTLTFAAFSRTAAIGATVLDQTKTTCQIVGGNVLTRYTDNTVRQNGYYIADADGAYNPTGSYVGLSDSAFAGSNTTGTLQATLAEVA